jgi:hypothetical protein
MKRYSPLHNNKGYALALMAALLPVLMGLLFLPLQFLYQQLVPP